MWRMICRTDHRLEWPVRCDHGATPPVIGRVTIGLSPAGPDRHPEYALGPDGRCRKKPTETGEGQDPFEAEAVRNPGIAVPIENRSVTRQDRGHRHQDIRT